MEIATILGPPIRTFNNRGHCKAGRGVRPGGLVTNWRWNMNTVKNKSHEASRVKQLVTGTIKHYPNASAELVFGGATRTVSALTELLQGFVDLRSAVVASQAATKAKVAAERAEAPALLAVIREYVAFVRATFGNSADALADFGLSSRKGRGPPKSVTVPVAVAKRKAARAPRHTIGKVQKKDAKRAVQATGNATPRHH